MPQYVQECFSVYAIFVMMTVVDTTSTSSNSTIKSKPKNLAARRKAGTLQLRKDPHGGVRGNVCVYGVL